MEPPSSPTASAPVRVIRHKTGLAALDLRQVWEYRDLLSTLSVREVQLRYRQTALGVVWVILQPLLSAVIFTFVFSKLAKLSTNGVDPLLFTFSSMLAWNLFSGYLGKASGIIVGNMGLVSKVYFPRLILPLSGLFSTMIDFGVAFVVLVVMMFAKGHPPTLTILALPLVLLLLITMALGISLFASALQVKYRDVAYVIPVAINMLFFISPVAYALSELGNKHFPDIVKSLYAANPIVGTMELARWSMLGTPFPGFGMVMYPVLFTIAFLIIGVLYFKTQERGFADVI